MVNEKIQAIKKEIEDLATKIEGNFSVMEVCGTHTMAMAKHAIRSLLPSNINIISGPGCPVCVTAQGDIQLAIDLAKRENFIIATFGDMLKIPARKDSLQRYKNVRMIYSPLDAIKIAQENPSKEVVLLGIGFETTVPLIAATIKEAHELQLKNFTVLPMHKLVPPALDAIFADADHKIKALLLPGHVSVVTGWSYFNFIEKYKVPGVVAGFDAQDLMESMLILIKMHLAQEHRVYNNYPRLVSEHGNKLALSIMDEVYEPSDCEWRKIGRIPLSGLTPRAAFAAYDAHKKFNLEAQELHDAPGCLCGEILMGKAKPSECKYFGKACTPINPIGPCMVSSEGTCAAYYKYQI